MPWIFNHDFKILTLIVSGIWMGYLIGLHQKRKKLTVIECRLFLAEKALEDIKKSRQLMKENMEEITKLMRKE